jgi:hypothetical protein
MSKDTYGNDLLPGEESAMFGDRSIAPPAKQHFKRDPSDLYNGDTTDTDGGKQNGGSHRRRSRTPKSSRKYKKSSKRVFRKKSRSTRRR